MGFHALALCLTLTDTMLSLSAPCCLDLTKELVRTGVGSAQMTTDEESQAI